MWLQIAIWVVTTVISAALAPKPEKPKPAALSDIEAPTVDESRSVPVLFGTRRLKGPNVVWYGDLRTTPIKSKGGKK